MPTRGSPGSRGRARSPDCLSERAVSSAISAREGPSLSVSCPAHLLDRDADVAVPLHSHDLTHSGQLHHSSMAALTGGSLRTGCPR